MKKRNKRSFSFIVIIIIVLLLSSCSPGTDSEADPNQASSEPVPEGTPSTSDDKPNPTQTPAPTLESDPGQVEEAQYREILNTMTLDEKLGQLLVVGYESDNQAEKMIREHKVGGIVLFSRNFDDFDQLYHITEQLNEYNQASPLPLWIALDEEGGTVTRLPSGKTPIPDAREVGSHGDVELTETVGWIIGREMAAAGTNLDFAPVVDIVDNPENTFMLKRSYGSTPKEVSEHGTAFLRGLQRIGVQGCAKHFPGHGDTAVDSHLDMPVIHSSLEEWKEKDAIPFQSMIDAGVEMIMVGHLAFPQIDPSSLPASMSSVFLQEQLRNRMGFEGLIITDDIEMQGYPQGEGRKEAVITSFLAGIDLFAVGHTPQVQLDVLEALKEGIETGRITEERIDESLMRIIKTKARLKNTPRFSLEEAREIFGSEQHREVFSSLLDN